MGEEIGGRGNDRCKAPMLKASPEGSRKWRKTHETHDGTNGVSISHHVTTTIKLKFILDSATEKSSHVALKD